MSTRQGITFIIYHVCVYVCRDDIGQWTACGRGVFPSALWISEIELGSLCLMASTFAL